MNDQWSLSEFLEQIQSEIREKFEGTYSVVAEIASMSGSRHLYFELIEKEGGQMRAKCRANLWAFNRYRVVGHFERTTRETLKTGMKVLLRVQADFHVQYGFSLTIVDIDPSFSLGEFERIKQETIDSLTADGFMEMNKALSLPLVFRRLAVVTSETAAGYQDFMQHLDNNAWGYTFSTMLFPCLVQGEQAPESIKAALDAVEMDQVGFDAIVLIRGGGSVIDLSCFNDYDLNAHLAQSSYPVITGIGHDRDISVADLVAHTHIKTPTAVAEYITQHNAVFEQQILQTSNAIAEQVEWMLNEEKEALTSKVSMIDRLLQLSQEREFNTLEQKTFQLASRSTQLIRDEQAQVAHFHQTLLRSIDVYLQKEQLEIERTEVQINGHNPETLFQRGYTLTLQNGKKADLTALKPGDELQTMGSNILITSTVKTIK